MATPAPFDDAIVIVRDINEAVAALDGPELQHSLSEVIDILDDVITALGLVNDVDTAWTVVDAASNAIGVVIDTITAFTEVIPGLDIVVDVLDGIVNLIDGLEDTVDGLLDSVAGVVNDILPILRDIATGLKDVQNLIRDMATELPALINTMKILQALAEIVQVIAPLFKPLGDQSTVAARLETVLAEYEAVDAEITKAATPLKSAFQAVEPPLSKMGEVLEEIKNIAGGAFANLETDVLWVADQVSSAESTAKGVANSLAPVRWVLHAVKSVVDKVIKPIISKIEHILGISALEKKLVTAIKSKLDFAAFETFQNYNGDGSSKKSNVFGNSQSATGSKQGAAMSDFWKDVGAALSDYKRGDSKSAVEEAVKALIDALTGGQIDLSSNPPLIQHKSLDLYVPKVTTPPDPKVLLTRAAELRATAGETVRSRRRMPGIALLAPADATIAPARELAGIADQIRTAVGSDSAAFEAMNAAAGAALTAMTTAAPSAAPAVSVLAQIAQFTNAPPRARVEVIALSQIVTAISDTLNRMTSLYPSETAALAKLSPQVDCLAEQLSKLASQEAALKPTLDTAPEQIAKTINQISQIGRLPAHASSIAAIAVSGATTLQLVAMLDQLNVELGHTEDTALAGVHQALDSGATDQANVLNGLVTDIQQIADALDSVRKSGGDVLSTYQGIAEWGVPISDTWLPTLLDAAKYARAIDSVLTPLSYLLEVGGGGTPPTGTQTDAETAPGDITDLVKQDALRAAEYIREGAVALLADLLEALPNVLEVITAEALHLNEMETLIATASQRLSDDLDTLVHSTAQVQTSLEAVEKGAVPPRTYPWTYTYDGKTTTIAISNAFVTAIEAETIAKLANDMVHKAIAAKLPLPDPSPLIQSWRT